MSALYVQKFILKIMLWPIHSKINPFASIGRTGMSKAKVEVRDILSK